MGADPGGSQCLPGSAQTIRHGFGIGSADIGGCYHHSVDLHRESYVDCTNGLGNLRQLLRWRGWKTTPKLKNSLHFFDLQTRH